MISREFVSKFPADNAIVIRLIADVERHRPVPTSVKMFVVDDASLSCCVYDSVLWNPER
jgi:hypothetical protein